MAPEQLVDKLSRLRKNDYRRKAMKKLEDTSTDIKALRRSIEKATNEEKDKESHEQQRNIFEEFEHAEAELEKILTLETSEIRQISLLLDRKLEKEKEINQQILRLSRETKQLQQQAQKIEKTILNGEKQFNTHCIEQALEHGTEKIYSVFEEATTPTKNALWYNVQEILKKKNQDNYQKEKQNFKKINLASQTQQNQDIVLQLSINYNKLLFETKQSSIDKTRFEKPKQDIREIGQLLNKLQKLSDKLEEALNKEKQILKATQLEKTHLPETIEGLDKLGKELQIIGTALQELKATEKEKQHLKQHLEHKENISDKISLFEQNLDKLEELGNYLQTQTDKLKDKRRSIREINDEEINNLDKLQQNGEKIAEHLKNASDKITHSEKIAIGPADNERQEFAQSSNKKHEIQLSITLDQSRELIKQIIHESEFIKQLSREEQDREIKIKRKHLNIPEFKF